MKEKIKELRKIVPVPMGKALQLLKDNGGNVEACVCLFKTESLNEIMEMTGCDREMATKHYEVEKYDYNRTVSSIREAIYDRNYVRVAGVTKEKIGKARQWLRIVEAEDFAFSLDYISLDEVVELFLSIPDLLEVGVLINKAKIAKASIFEGYKDSDPIEEFVRRHSRLDNDEDFQAGNENIRLRLSVIGEELQRHNRNLRE